jgi:hypothetical protein
MVQTINKEVHYFNKTVISLQRDKTFRIHVSTNLLMLLGNNRCLLGQSNNAGPLDAVANGTQKWAL